MVYHHLNKQVEPLLTCFPKYISRLTVIPCPLFPDFSCGAMPMSASFFSRQHPSPLQTVSTEIQHWPGNYGLEAFISGVMVNYCTICIGWTNYQPDIGKLIFLAIGR